MKTRTAVLLSCVIVVVWAVAAGPLRKRISLPSSKIIIGPVPGNAQPMGSFPVNIQISPDKKYAAILEAGYGTIDTELHQSVAVLDFSTGQITRFADPRLGYKAKQSFFLGLAWSSDGKHIYAPVGSITDPTGTKPQDPKNKDDKFEHLGNGVIVYSFDGGKIAPERFIKIAPQPLAAGKKRGTIHKDAPPNTLAPYPAGIAVVKRDTGDQLLVADNLSDDVLLIDAQSGEIVHRFDLSEGDYVPGLYPYAVAINEDGSKGWVSLWNTAEIAELDLAKGAIVRRITVSNLKNAATAHPSALAYSSDGALYVALSNEDRVAMVDPSSGKVTKYLSTKLPGQRSGGSYPSAVALDAFSDRLFVANSSSDAIAVFELNAPNPYLLGFLPTEWYPTALAVHGDELLIATGKGVGTGPNNIPKKPGELGYRKGYTYLPTLLKGSLARVSLKEVEPQLKQLTDEVLESNLMNGKAGVLPFKAGKNPIKHVIYIIKENRSYDQVFGDLGVGNGDKSLTMYGEDITPNEHALARQFGVLDNFYDSGDVSGNGHVWSNAAITSDYTEKTWQIGYRGWERTYDYEGRVADDYPIEVGVPDVNEPGTGYLWTNLARNKKTYLHFGEYISTHWCDRGGDADAMPQEGTPLPLPENCKQKNVAPGEPFPTSLGYNGELNPYGWPVPLIARNVATKPELRGHFDPNYPDFRLEYPDQLRVDEFLKHFNQWVTTLKKSKRDTMPQFIQLRLPNDHTAGTKLNNPTPEASIADNDLAVGRVAEAISNSAYWDDTAIFILEDDAQDGADHVDAHRSIALVISKYAPGSVQQPHVDSHFYTTVNMIHTMEVLLGLPPMNNNDAQAQLMAPLFSGPGTQPVFKADYRNRDNRLIYTANKSNAPGAKESAAMDFTHADHVDTAKLNEILWRERMGDKPMPPVKRGVMPEKAGGDDDDDD